tara:strand:- start:118 stop:390 length:273 start_codon:yes stop_codon:yes gene_type:complete
MPDITVNITDTEEKALNYICVGITTFTENFIKNRARKAKEEIVSLNMKHCNENGISIGVGVTAQIDQAYALGVVKTAVQRNIDAQNENEK